MMYTEFLQLAKVESKDVTSKQYTEIFEPMYYAADMNKQQFVEFMRPSIKALAEKNRKEAQAQKAEELTVFISDGSTTPNGCYYMGIRAKLVSLRADISTGKRIYKVRQLTKAEESEERKHWDLDLAYTIDIDTRNPQVDLRWAK